MPDHRSTLMICTLVFHFSFNDYYFLSGSGQSALHMATTDKNLVAMKSLVACGWSVNQRDGNAKTPVLIVCLLVSDT